MSRRAMTGIVLLAAAWVGASPPAVDPSANASPSADDQAFTRVAKLLPAPDADNGNALFGLEVAIDGTRMVAWINDRMHGDFSGALDVFDKNRNTADEWNHVARISTAETAAFESFGLFFGLDNDTIVAGAPYDDSVGEDSGSVFIFQREQGEFGEWRQAAKLVPFDGGSHDNFGSSVAIDGDTVVVGTQDNAGGSVYIYDRNQGGPDAWGLVTSIWKANGSFGNAVGIFGDTLIVGSFRDDDNGTESGSAYVYDRNLGGTDSWGQVAKLVASDGSQDEWFGYSVAIDSDTAFVGTPFDEDTAPNSGSAYAYQRDQGGSNAWGQVAKLTPSDGVAGDFFGYRVSISGDVAVVGAWGNDHFGVDSGAAYLFQRDEGGPDAWGQSLKIKSTNGAAWDNFGASVGISSDVVAIGAPGHDGGFLDSGSVEIFESVTGPSGHTVWIPCPPVLVAERESFGISASMDGTTAIVGAPQDDDNGSNSGSATVFLRDEGGTSAWGQVAKLTPDDAMPDDGFGVAVSVDGDTAIVGAEGSIYVFDRDLGGSNAWGQVAKASGSSWAFGFAVSVSGDTAVIGNRGDNSFGADSGASHILERHHNGPDAWGQVVELFASDATSHALFGHSVSIDGDTAVIGAPQFPPYSSQVGAAYVFLRDLGGADAWQQVVMITASDGGPNDLFGSSVSIDGDTIIVGSPHHDVYLYRSGSAYVFQRNHGGVNAWGQVAKITPADGASGDHFGFSVSIRDDTAIIGAHHDDDTGENSGTAYVFMRDLGGSNTWGQAAKITCSDCSEAELFGTSVSVTGSTALVGAPDSDGLGEDSGAAYVFFINHPFFADGFETADTSAWSVTVP